MREFKSKGNAKQEEERTFAFKLDDQEFKCVLRGDADSVMEWSEMAAAADETDLESAAGVAFTAKFFKLVMAPGEYGRFRSHMRQQRTEPDVLMDIMQAINEEMQALTESNASRPTQPPSSSSGGRVVTDERKLRIISPDGDIVTAPAPAISGPTAEQAEAMGLGEKETLGAWNPNVPLAEQLKAL